MSKSVQTVQKCLKWPESVQSCQTSRNSIRNFFGTPCTRSISLGTIPVTRWAKISLGTSGRQHCGSSVSRGLFCSASVCGILRYRGKSHIVWSYMFVLFVLSSVLWVQAFFVWMHPCIVVKRKNVLFHHAIGIEGCNSLHCVSTLQ